jgi:Peptidase_C39 like family
MTNHKNERKLSMKLSDQIKRIAGLELNGLRATEALGEEFEKVAIPGQGTPIYDINGEVLFYRLALRRGRTASGYADIAVHEVLGEPLVATSMGIAWDEKTLLEAGTDAARKQNKSLKYDEVRFVAFSFPKIALQFLVEKKEVLMLELYTWAEVPQEGSKDRKPLEPANFERWSLIEELPDKIKRARAKSFKERLAIWDTLNRRNFKLDVISKSALLSRDFIIQLVDTRELHYSSRNSDHHICYELRGQQTNVWCVGASTEMLLNFYRYSYDQVRLAQELGLGTLAHPNGLSYANVGLVVTVIENLTSNSLDATMFTNPGFNLFRDEIRANRPLISFIPGHSRTVAGYTQNLFSLVGTIPYRGLLVYDPWPPNAGVITRWENFATQTYQFAYSAVIRQI